MLVADADHDLKAAQPNTLTSVPAACVSGASNMQDESSPMMSLDTIGSVL
jgi:hypothetical protein